MLEMIHRIGVVILLFASAASSGQNTASAQNAAWNFPDFSASQVFAMPNLPMMKIYRSGLHIRIDNPPFTTLYAHDKGQIYMLTAYPGAGISCSTTAVEHTGMMIPTPLEYIFRPGAKRISLPGTEVIDGHPARIEKVVSKGPDDTTIESKAWLAQDLEGIRVKIESTVAEQRISVTFRDIKIGTPDASLFIRPSNCPEKEPHWPPDSQQKKPGK